jgi:hypothetical protein
VRKPRNFRRVAVTAIVAIPVSVVNVKRGDRHHVVVRLENDGLVGGRQRLNSCSGGSQPLLKVDARKAKTGTHSCKQVSHSSARPDEVDRLRLKIVVAHR